MKAALVLLAAVAALAVCDARRRTTTARPCLERCSLEYIPVCAQDPRGAYYLFTNQCLLRACACRTNIEFTKLDDKDDCPSDARTKCPDLQADFAGYADDSLEVPDGQSDSSDSSDAANSEAARAEGRWAPPVWIPPEGKPYPF